MNHYHAHHYTSETHHKQDIYYLTNSYNGTLCWKVTQTIWLLQYTVTARKYFIIFHHPCRNRHSLQAVSISVYALLDLDSDLLHRMLRAQREQFCLICRYLADWNSDIVVYLFFYTSRIKHQTVPFFKLEGAIAPYTNRLARQLFSRCGRIKIAASVHSSVEVYARVWPENFVAFTIKKRHRQSLSVFLSRDIRWFADWRELLKKYSFGYR